MPKNNKDKSKTSHQQINDLFQQFKDDWTPAGIIFPTYAGPRNLTSYEFYNSNAEVTRRNYLKERQRVHYLKKNRWIETKTTEDGLLIALTNNGRVEKMRRCMEQRPILKNGKVCLVVFDIPEIARRARNTFRQFLKKCGFRRLQKSVWENDRDVVNDVLQFIQRTNIHSWAKVYLGENKC